MPPSLMEKGGNKCFLNLKKKKRKRKRIENNSVIK